LWEFKLEDGNLQIEIHINILAVVCALLKCASNSHAPHPDRVRCGTRLGLMCDFICQAFVKFWGCFVTSDEILVNFCGKISLIRD
jgi:hypothetical protein